MDVLPLENGGVRFLEMPGAFYDQLSQLAETCDPGDDPAIAKRLAPHPMDPAENDADRAAAEEDWSDYVRPELEASFQHSLSTVMSDLSLALPSDEGFDHDDQYFHLEIPRDHVPFWFQVLNRARIVLSLRHSLPVTENSLSSEEPMTLARLLAAHLSEHYAEILEILVHQMGQEFP